MCKGLHCVFGLLLALGIVVTASGAEILEHYPSCHYEVYKSITMKQSLLLRRTASKSKSIELSIQQLLKRLVDAAESLGAKGVVLTRRVVKEKPQADEVSMTSPVSSRLGYVAFDADFISACNGSAYTYTDKPTPFNQHGERQHAYQTTLQLSLTLSLPSLNLTAPTHNQPALADNDVSIENGVFGIKVGMPVEKITDMLGSPTSAFQINPNTLLLSYGRYFWITLQNNAVVQVSNQNQWLSGELLNLFEFDQRFETQWTVENTLRKGQSAKAMSATALGEFIPPSTFRIKGNNNEVIDVGFSTFIAGDANSKLIETFTYGLVDYTGVKVDDSLGSYNETVYRRVYDLVHNKSDLTDQISEDSLGAQPILTARGTDRRTIRVYDASLVLIFEHDNLVDVIVSEALFLENGAPVSWQFGRLSHNQTVQGVRNLFGDDIYERDADHWEVYLDDVKYDLFFSEFDNALLLSAFEMDVF